MARRQVDQLVCDICRRTEAELPISSYRIETERGTWSVDLCEEEDVRHDLDAALERLPRKTFTVSRRHRGPESRMVDRPWDTGAD